MSYQPDVLMSSVEDMPAGGAFVRRRQNPARTALVSTVHALYPLCFANADRPPVTADDLSARDGEKVTVLVHSTSNVFRAPELLAVQGRVITQGLTGLALILRGRRTKGIPLTPGLVDAVPGWGDDAVSQLRARCHAVRALLPDEIAPLTPATINTVLEQTGPEPPPCATVLLTSTALPGLDPIHGCLWLISHRTPNPGDATLNGVLLAPPESALESTYGSIRARQLPRSTAVLPTAATLTYADAVDLADLAHTGDPARGYLDALARLTTPDTPASAL
ncbi:hypothetical protein ACFWGI_35685 [Streptomyces niveus]|uniref:hypothetical protein n=1 Tax=Streptomyces niveus TaxID=193462 RepID=UPI00365CA471